MKRKETFNLKVLEYPFDNLYILRNKKSIKKELLQRGDFIKKRIAVLSGSTIGDIKNILELFLLNHGIKPEFYVGQFNRFYEEAVFENAELEKFNPEIIYIHTSNRNISVFPDVGDDVNACNNKLMQVYRHFKNVWNSIQEKYKCIIIQNNFELLPYRVLGNADIYLDYGMNHFIQELNEKFYEYARTNSNFFINDINYLSSWVGLEKWSDASYWHLYKYSLNMEYIPILCHNIANIIKSILGKNKKALILDLDNTLWGGVIGDDGVENIRLGYESPEGSAFLEFQKYIKKLGDIGVLLNICSKNEPEAAEAGFSHPSSVLNKSDFICFKANWDEKYVNVSEIVKELNIMSDSVIFIDDNPVERDSVRRFIPSIAVPELRNPENYINILDKSGYFEVTTLSEDDIKRAKNYKDNQARELFKTQFSDYSEYLQSLNMKCTVSGFQSKLIPRITQLINKTNQFNLTTKRYTQSEVEELLQDNSYITLCADLQDKFGDNGIVTAIIGKINGEILAIELWVMSCRVFKRNLEYAMFDEIVGICQKRNIRKLIGLYRPSGKNSLVKDFYKNLGFLLSYESDNECKWEYSVPKHYQNKNKVIEVFYGE